MKEKQNLFEKCIKKCVMLGLISYNYIANCYYLDEMSQTVKDIITSCEICQKRKTLTGKTKDIIHKLNANEPFEKIYVDICGPLQTTVTQKNMYWQ